MVFGQSCNCRLVESIWHQILHAKIPRQRCHLVSHSPFLPVRGRRVRAAAGKISFRRYRRGGRIKKRGTGEISIPTTYILQHDINSLRTGINPGNRPPGAAFSEAPFGERGSNALWFNGLLKGKGMKVSGAVPCILYITGLLVRQLTNRFLRELANTAEFAPVEKHLAPAKQVLDR